MYWATPGSCRRDAQNCRWGLRRAHRLGLRQSCRRSRARCVAPAKKRNHRGQWLKRARGLRAHLIGSRKMPFPAERNHTLAARAAGGSWRPSQRGGEPRSSARTDARTRLARYPLGPRRVDSAKQQCDRSAPVRSSPVGEVRDQPHVMPAAGLGDARARRQRARGGRRQAGDARPFPGVSFSTAGSPIGR